MEAHPTLDRRQFVVGATLAGASLVVSASAAAAEASGPVEIGPWIAIHPDDTVVVRIAKSEIGQGVFTSNAMMVAEELQCDWAKVRPEFVDVNRHLRENKLYGRLETTAASSARESRDLLQRVGASARERLKLAAAQAWDAPVGEVETKNGVLTHAPTGRSLRYGEMAARAATIKLDHEPAPKTPAEFTLMGTRVARLDTGPKTRGEPIFAIDARLPGMVYASLRLRPTLDSALESYDFDAVKAMPGVIAAVRLTGIGGQDGVAIVADSFWRAETALRKMPIRWTRAGEAFSSQAILQQARDLATTNGLAIVKDGDAGAVFDSAAKRFAAVYETPMQAHAPLETVNCTARLSDGRLDVWAGAQAPEDSLRSAAKAAGLPTEQVFLHNHFIGGGFGGRTDRGEVAQAVAIAKTLNGRPVKLIWPREEEMRNNAYHPFGVTRCEAALDPDAKPIAMTFIKAGDVTGEPQAIGPLKAVVNGQNSRSLYDLPYGLAAARVDVHDMRTGLPVGIWRSVGDYHNVFAIECFVDELAHEAKTDPLAFRRALLDAGTKYWNREHWVAALDRLAATAHWGAPSARGTGLGLAISDHRRPGRTDSAICAVAAQVVVANDGVMRVERVHVVFESGLGLINPLVIEQQLRGQIAWSLGSVTQEISVVDGRVRQANYDDYPMVRMADAPPLVTIDYLKTDRWIQGVGEMLVPMVPPAICNAIFAATGKRLRTLPLRQRDLAWT